MTVQLLFGSWSAPGAPRGYQTPPAPDPADERLSVFLLANESWNDYHFRTDFIAHLHIDGNWHTIGHVSIGYLGQQEGPHTYEELGRPDRLAVLPERFFSLGQDLGYYEELLRRAGGAQAEDILTTMRDIALDPRQRDAVKQERVLHVSLTRSNGSLEALEQAAALFGRAPGAVTNAFTATLWLEGADAPHVFNFDFTPKPIPSRVSVLVGLNGTGKTQSMALLARLLSRVFAEDPDAESPTTDERNTVQPRPSIYGVLAVSFSAFDDFIVPTEHTSGRFKYVYCGLKSLRGEVTTRAEIAETEVAQRFLALPTPADRLRALEPLQPTLDADFDLDEMAASGALPYSYLSAGQRIVLSIASELIRNMSSRVLVMMDEPEIHLHPQLLSSLLAWMEDLLAERDAFAIVATHSPIVVQQVASSSVFVLRRLGAHPVILRPAVETFGANLTEIVREVFEDRAGDRSYQEILDRLIEAHGSPDKVMRLFGGQLGLNAQLYLRSREGA